MKLDVIYEDNHIIAVYKPAGLLVQSEKRGDENLLDITREYLKEKYNKPGNVFLGLVHRLDRPASGIVLFGKTSKGAARLSEQFREGTIKKIYMALVIGTPEKKKDTLTHYLKKDEGRKASIVSDEPKPEYQKAVLNYEVIEEGENSKLRVELITGRFHQIRAQLSHIGHPIVGDIKYHAPERLPDLSIKLCASEIEFKLATQEEIKHLEVNCEF